MTMSRIFAAAVAMTMLGGVGAFASTAPSVQNATGQTSAQTVDQQGWALNMPRDLPSAAAAAPQASAQPRQLPLADFGQWDTSASEN